LGAPDTVGADPRIIALVEAQDSTIDAQRRAIARQQLALSTATSSLAVADSLLANRARQMVILESQIPPRWKVWGERVVIAGAAGYAGYRAGLTLRR
jgi:hypothetical protein